MKSYRVKIFSLAVLFFSLILVFQNCEQKDDGTSDSIGVSSRDGNGVPYTGLAPEDGDYLAFKSCANGKSLIATNVSAKIRFSEDRSSARVTDGCTGKQFSISSNNLFYTDYALEYLSFDSTIFQQVSNFNSNNSYTSPRIVCWLGPGNGGTTTSGINLAFDQDKKYLDYILTGEFSDSGEKTSGRLTVERVADVESGPEVDWIFLEGEDFNMTVTDDLNPDGLLIATFEGVLESNPALYEFACERQF